MKENYFTAFHAENNNVIDILNYKHVIYETIH